MPTDMLKDIFYKQNGLVEHIKKSKPKFWGPEPFTGYRKFMLASALLHEAVEYQRETQWKWWKENHKVNTDNRKNSELPDIFHFFIQLCIEEGITPEYLYQKYMDKLSENHHRQNDNY